MFKTLFFILMTLVGFKAHADVTVKWLTVASIVVDDGKTRILFDPAWTRPGIRHVLNLAPFISDEALVTKILDKNGINKVDAIFSSHSHFDHVVDAPMVSKLTGAIFYTDQSSQILASAYNDSKIRTVGIKPEEKIQIGDFLITPMNRQHAQILHLFDFLPGHVPGNTKLSFWDYHVGDTWLYLIEHPDGTILIDQGSQAQMQSLSKYASKVDVLIQGIANRKSDEAVIEGYAKKLSPSVFIPLHFDNFFADFKDGVESFLPGINFDSLMDKMKKAYPTMKVDKPLYGQSIKVLETKR